jgi:hypothetical protein
MHDVLLSCVSFKSLCKGQERESKSAPRCSREIRERLTTGEERQRIKQAAGAQLLAQGGNVHDLPANALGF